MKHLLFTLLMLIPFGLQSQNNVIEPELISEEVIITGEFNHYLNQRYIFKDKLYFLGADETHGSELWVTEGTPTSTYMLKDFTLNGNSDIYLFVANLDKLVFSVKDENGKGSLWATDGTKSGTILLANVTAQVGFDNFRNGADFQEFNGKIIFSGDDGIHGSEPWVTDGTPEGTYMIQDLGNNGGSNPYFFNHIGDKFIFSTSKNVGFNSVIWSTDFSKNSCNRIYQGNDKQSNIIDVGLDGQLLIVNSFFDPVSETDYTMISVTNGTSSGTFPILGEDKNLKGNLIKYTKVKDQVFFIMSYIWDSLLYVTDGTKNGTKLLIEELANVAKLQNWDDKIFFQVDANGNYISDGTKEGTFEINELIEEPILFLEYFIMGDKLYFADKNDDGLISIWESDGTKSGTRKVKTMDETDENVDIGFKNSFYGNIVFDYYESGKPGELWMTDGTEEGTKKIIDFFSLTNLKYYSLSEVKQYGEYLLVIPSYPLSRDYMFLLNREGELTKVEPKGATKPRKFSNESGRTIFGNLNGYLYFKANYYDTGEQLWKIKVDESITSIEETQKPELMTVYPNPAKEYIQLELNKPMHLSIVNSTGAKVKDYGLVANGKLNVAELTTGVYFVVDEQGKSIAKFVKE